MLSVAKRCVVVARPLLLSRSFGAVAPPENVERSVFISQSPDIFANLALEDWLYRNADFSKHQILFVWRNDPCVVIGRHQNPWVEANLPLLKDKGVALARRNSGGGTVYHDRGNLNCTFFTVKGSYNRKKNLEVVTRALQREFGLLAEINKREDVTLEGFKLISGSASKLGKNAYHHCTLLVDASISALGETLKGNHVDSIKSNATESTRTPVTNLSQILPSVSMEKVVAAVGWEYLRTNPITNEDGGKEQLAKQRGFKMINPTDSWFPGLAQTVAEYKSWDWLFGKTPKFTITRSFLIPNELVGSDSSPSSREITIQLQVDRGLLEDVTLRLPPEFSTNGVVDVATPLRGRRFSEDVVTKFEDMLFSGDKRKDRFVADCMKRVVSSV